MNRTKRTPCVGICSTTYGDLVCRGCKRFAHEIVGWNQYAPEQRERIWSRLEQLRDEVIAQWLPIDDHERFCAAVDRAELTALTGPLQRYELLVWLIKTDTDPVRAGLQGRGRTALALMQEIDAEVYSRSLAHYERNFKIASG